MATQDIKPEPAPELNIPKSDSVCDVSIINSTLDLTVPSQFFGRPSIKGHEMWNMPTYCFHLKHRSSGRQICFDIGGRKDWWNYPPAVDKLIRGVLPGLNIRYNVNEILEKGGVDLNKIESVVWSHWHFDHIGDIQQFPKSTSVIVGPKFKESFMPGHPAKEDAPVFSADFDGRGLREIDFSEGLKIGQFRAHDFFGDGSFYLLDVPGHAIGHMSGLVRTTPDTFLFLGGDVCHYGGMHRPTKYVPMPAEIPAGTPLDAPFSSPCPCALFTKHHPGSDSRTTPFYQVTEMEGSWYADPPVAQKSIDLMGEFDANPNVFVCLAHDPKLIPVCDWFPHGTMNDWKSKGWKETVKWGFLNELPDENSKPTRGWLAKGLMSDCKQDVAPDEKWTKFESFSMYPELCRPSFEGKSGV